MILHTGTLANNACRNSVVADIGTVDTVLHKGKGCILCDTCRTIDVARSDHIPDLHAFRSRRTLRISKQALCTVKGNRMITAVKGTGKPFVGGTDALPVIANSDVSRLLCADGGQAFLDSIGKPLQVFIGSQQECAALIGQRTGCAAVIGAGSVLVVMAQSVDGFRLGVTAGFCGAAYPGTGVGLLACRGAGRISSYNTMIVLVAQRLDGLRLGMAIGTLGTYRTGVGILTGIHTVSSLGLHSFAISMGNHRNILGIAVAVSIFGATGAGKGLCAYLVAGGLFGDGFGVAMNMGPLGVPEG